MPGRPDAGRRLLLESVQHVDGLVELKASLTEDEDADVLEYARSHPAFPHETTADQFFDEAQWESYRRLGYHVGKATPPLR